jgi:succinate dehydrogenase / fumarate reductase flavoprotein subunit
MLTEIRAGRGVGPDQDHIDLDLTHLAPEFIDAKLPDITDFVRTYLGLEPKTEPIPVQPTAHYAMGGIPTNVRAEVVVDADDTVLPGLYAAGECACVSVHGANRLGTNSLLDIVVFGKRGGRAMVEYVAGADRPALPTGVEDDVRGRIEGLKGSTGGEKVGALRAALQEEMTDKASVFRTEDTLARAMATVDDLRQTQEKVAIDDKGHVFNYDLTEALELGYLVDLAESLVASARARTESRGGHFRDDHPHRDDADWLKHTLVWREEDGRIRLDYKPVALGRYQPMERVY